MEPSPSRWERALVALALVIITALTASVVIPLLLDALGPPPDATPERSRPEAPPELRAKAASAQQERAPLTLEGQLALARRQLYQKSGRLQGLEIRLREARRRRDQPAIKRHRESLDQTKRQIGDLERRIRELEARLGSSAADAAPVTPEALAADGG